MIEVMGDDEHTKEYKKLVERDAEKLRSSSTDNISLALRIGSKQNLTDKDEKKTNMTEEELEVARTSLEQRKTELRQNEKS